MAPLRLLSLMFLVSSLINCMDNSNLNAHSVNSAPVSPISSGPTTTSPDATTSPVATPPTPTPTTPDSTAPGNCQSLTPLTSPVVTAQVAAEGQWQTGPYPVYRITETSSQQALAITNGQLVVEPINNQTSQLWMFGYYNATHMVPINTALYQCLNAQPVSNQLAVTPTLPGDSNGCWDNSSTWTSWSFNLVGPSTFTIYPNHHDTIPDSFLGVVANNGSIAVQNISLSNPNNTTTWQITPVDTNGIVLNQPMCKNQPLGGPYKVYVGGTYGLTNFTSSTYFPYVSSHADGYYNDPNGWNSLTTGQQLQMAKAFTNKKTVTYADNTATGADADITYATNLITAGFSPFLALNSNLMGYSNYLTTWPEIVATDLSDNLTAGTMLDTGSINYNNYPQLWSDSNMQIYKNYILQANASSNNAPSYAFTTYGPTYLRMTYQIIDWMRGANIPYLTMASTVTTNFLAETKLMVSSLEDNGCEPDSYGVTSNQNVPLTPESTSIDEQQYPIPYSSTVAGAALYLLEHRDGIPGTLNFEANNQIIQQITVPANGNVTSLNLALVNSSSHMDYAPALVANASSGMNVQFISNGVDISSDVLGNVGHVFNGSYRLLPESSQTIGVQLTTCTPGSTLTLSLYPHAYVKKPIAVLTITIQ